LRRITIIILVFVSVAAIYFVATTLNNIRRLGPHVVVHTGLFGLGDIRAKKVLLTGSVMIQTEGGGWATVITDIRGVEVRAEQ
jgi:hypothetical protein